MGLDYHSIIAPRRAAKTGQYEKWPQARFLARRRRVLPRKVVPKVPTQQERSSVALGFGFLCLLLVWSGYHSGITPRHAAKTGQS